MYLFIASTQVPFIVLCIFPTLASGASIARGSPPPFGGAHLAPFLRSRWDIIGQKPEPAISRRKTYKQASLREKGGTRQGFPETNEMSFGGSLRSVTEGACVTLSLCELD